MRLAEKGPLVVQVLLLTRGDLAREWLRATEAVCGGPAKGMEVLTLDWDGRREEDLAHVRTKVHTMLDEGPVLILTDLHGSTPTNLAAEQAEDREVVVVAGANLAMVLRLACDERCDRSASELADWICDKGRNAIQRVERSPGSDR